MGLYLTRALKYLLKMVVLIAVVFAAMALTGTLNHNPADLLHALFMSSRGWILVGVLVAWSAAYPKMSFTAVDVRCNIHDDREGIINAFATYGYSLTEESDNRMVFRADSTLKRALNQFDDKITVTGEGRYVAIEGLKKVVSRVETRLGSLLVP